MCKYSVYIHICRNIYTLNYLRSIPSSFPAPFTYPTLLGLHSPTCKIDIFIFIVNMYTEIIIQLSWFLLPIIPGSIHIPHLFFPSRRHNLSNLFNRCSSSSLSNLFVYLSVYVCIYVCMHLSHSLSPSPSLSLSPLQDFKTPVYKLKKEQTYTTKFAEVSGFHPHIIPGCLGHGPQH